MDVLRSILCGHGACEEGVERKAKMKAGDLRPRLSRNANRVLRFGVYGSVAAASFLVARAGAGPNYALEERFLPDQVSKLVFDLAVTPHWFSESDRFWYSYQTTEGTRYYIVDPLKKSKTPLWDNAKVAAALSTLTNFPYDAQHLPVKRLKLVEKDTRMRIEVEIRKNAEVPDQPKKEKSQEGVEQYSYALVLLPEQEEQLKKENTGDTNKAGPRTPAITVHWSKDSKKFALEREDNRKVGDYWVIHSLTNPRPILEARSYPLPGEANMPVSEIDIFDAASKQRAVVQPKNFVDEVLTISDAPQMERDREELREEQEENRLNPTPLSRLSPRWVADTSDKLYFTSRSRDFRHVNVEVADSATGKAQKLIEESSNVWMSQKPVRLVENGKELLWGSERG